MCCLSSFANTVWFPYGHGTRFRDVSSPPSLWAVQNVLSPWLRCLQYRRLRATQKWQRPAAWAGRGSGASIEEKLWSYGSNSNSWFETP
jgi:hypothetical protein